MDDRSTDWLRTTVCALLGIMLVGVAGLLIYDIVNWAAIGTWLHGRAGVALVAFGIGLFLLAAAIEAAIGRNPRRVRRTLSWWMIAAGALLVGAVTWTVMSWLLSVALAANDPAAARIDAIKTGLGVGAGTGGVIALLLAARRQWHQEIATFDLNHDASERRVTELYTKAAEQLGSDKAPVRLAGVYALERLAQGHPLQRQTIVNVLCAYLRVPYSEPGEPPATDAEEVLIKNYQLQVQELQVRFAAQRVLVDHLALPTKDASAHFWSGIDLTLDGATLISFGLPGCQVNSARFSGATFVGGSSFDGAIFNDSVSFAAARFTSTERPLRVSFSGLNKYNGTTWFNGAHFARDVWFVGAKFEDNAFFQGTSFQGFARFDHVEFDHKADFRRAKFVQRIPPEIIEFLGSNERAVSDG